MATRAQYDVVFYPVAPSDIYAGRNLCVQIPEKIIPYIIAALDPYTYPDAYLGTRLERDLTAVQVDHFRATLAAREECRGDSETECPPRETRVMSACGGGGYYDCGGCEMPNCSGPSVPIKVENGAIWWWACCDWVKVGDVEAFDTDTETGELIAPPDGTVPSTGSACGTAVAILGSIVDVAVSITENLNPLTLVKGVRGDNPGLKLNAGYIWDAYLAYLQIVLLDEIDPLDPLTEILWDEEAIFDADRLQAWICRYKNIFKDEYTVPTKQQIKAAWEIAKGIYPLFVVSFWQSVTLAIGFDQLAEVGQFGSQITDADCDCPADADPLETPNAAGWYLSQEYDMQQTTFVADNERNVVLELTPEHDVFGVVFAINLVDVLNLKTMDAGPVDGTLQDWGADSSQNIFGYLSRVCVGPAALWDVLFGAGTYSHQDTGQLASVTPASPSAAGTGGNRQGLAMQSVFNHGGTCVISGIRLLHNTNSPSHA